MIMQYDDMVLQVVTRLRNVIPQGPTPAKIADVIVMQNAQKEIENFFSSQEQSKIMVTYSGNGPEGGREVKDFVKTLGSNVQEMAHTIEVHICTKKYMNEALDGTPNTMLRLMYAVRAGLVGLKFYTRTSGVINFGKPEEEVTGGLFLVESFIDRTNLGGIISVCRFQCVEFVPPAEDVDPELIWGTYQEITLEEYSQQDGRTPDVSGSANDTAVVTDD